MKARCPICQTELEGEERLPCRPFCSPRCKKQDLKNWLDGIYRLPREIEPGDLESLSEDEQAELLEALGGPKIVH